MNSSLSHFKATLQRRKERTESRDKVAFGKTSVNTHSSKPNFNFPKMTEKEFAKFKASLETQKRTKNILNYILFGSITLLILATVWYLN